MSTDYSEFRVLIDEAAADPELGFPAYATALAEIVTTSPPEFAIGIFGSWGTGKTTLMRQLRDRIDGRDDVVTAWFTAWRYEREPHLIVPLIDVLREALDKEAEVEPPEGPARRAARMLRKAGRAFIAGLTISGKLAGVEVQLDASKVMDEIEAGADVGSEALSFYHSAFLLLRQAIEEFSQNGRRRVVIFVDDLDRCFPTNALDVLESMKLFFDVRGCIFVVGLDQGVAERAVSQKYKSPDAAPGETVTPVSGVDYLKKIFQVPFALPRVGTEQLSEYCNSMLRSANLADAQLNDFHTNVAPHLGFLPDQDSVNPREIKRLINAYVLQVKMLNLRLWGDVNPHIVLALQVMNFRPDWRDLYEELAADPGVFQQTVRDAVLAEQPQDHVWLAGQQLSLPTQLAQYLRSLARPVLDHSNLLPYVSAAESSRSTDPFLLDAQATLNRLRIALEGLANGLDLANGQELSSQVSRLNELGHRRGTQSPMARDVSDLVDASKRLLLPSDGAVDPDAQSILRQRAIALTTRIEAEIRDLRRQSDLGAYS